jgi:hypothetical protein
MSPLQSIDEIQQRAAERWRRNYHDQSAGVGAHGAQASTRVEHSKEEKNLGQDLDHDLEP